MTQTRIVKLLCLAASALTTLSLHAGADAEDGCGAFRGVANLDQCLVLTPTTNAPAHASGKAEFLAANDNGTNYEALFVKTTGLTNGTFTVSLTDDTGTNTYTLGTLNVSSVTNSGGGCFGDGREEDDQERAYVQVSGSWGCSGGTNTTQFSGWGGESEGGVGWSNWVSACSGVYPAWTNLLNLGDCTNLHCFATNACHWYTNTLTRGSGSFILPPGLSETNAGVLTISDADGVVYLTGDFSSATQSTVVYREQADLVAGADTNIQGSATVSYRQVRAKTCGTFRLDASGLPAHTKLYLTANGTQTVKAFTRRDGTLKVRALPRVNLSTLTSVTATDASGNVVFSVNF